jgi:Lamin Tail Domain/PEP-CTERM motif
MLLASRKVLEIMEKHLSTRLIVAASALLFAAATSHAAIVITEVDPSGSGATNTYNQDWFELTNTGSAAQDITGWAMDDSSDAFATAVPLRGVTSIAPGQSVVFIEDGTNSANDAALDTAFTSFWFGSNVPTGLTIANYGGSGVGLSASGDAVNIFDASGNAVTGVTFGASTPGVSFDNVAGNSVLSTISVVGTNGAFASANAVSGDANEIGSPGVISGAVATPEPASLGLLAVGGLALIARRRK